VLAWWRMEELVSAVFAGAVVSVDAADMERGAAAEGHALRESVSRGPRYAGLGVVRSPRLACGVIGGGVWHSKFVRDRRSCGVCSRS